MPIVKNENTIEQENINSSNETNNPQEQDEVQTQQPTIATVEVIDNESPIIFLFGAPNSGKTMTLVRLYRYLLKNQTSIVADHSFVSNDGGNYESRCKNWDNDATSPKAAEATKGIEFMLLGIWHNGNKICQILESPGEKLFQPNSNNGDNFPVQYVSNIINSNNKKVYIILLEPNWKDQQTRARYVARINQLRTMMSRKDKVIFLYNKIDASLTLGNRGSVNIHSLKKLINQDYVSLLDLFKNENPISKLWREYDCFLVPFQTGNYSEETDLDTNDIIKIFTPGKDSYPKHLWETIQKCL
jgi:GTPase SAR1 family protein